MEAPFQKKIFPLIRGVHQRKNFVSFFRPQLSFGKHGFLLNPPIKLIKIENIILKLIFGHHLL